MTPLSHLGQRWLRQAGVAAATLLGAVLWGLVLPTSPVHAADAPKELKLGFQKSSANLTLLKHRKALEQRLGGAIKVTWFEFNAGPPMLEALAVGSIDFGMTGDTPPIFAQAAGTDLLYVGAEPPKPDNSAVLVKQESPIKTVSDLKGKKIALQKGSSAHYLTVRALQQAGLQWSDIVPAYLTPAEARAAFERGSVDAWAIWDPYWAAAEKSLSPRVLVTSRGLVSNHTFYLANRAFAQKNGDLLKVLFDELTKSDALVVQKPQEAIQVIATSTGLDYAAAELYVNRRPRSPVGPITQSMIDEQQTIGDTFYRLNLIPKQINVKEAVWQPSSIPVASK